MSPLTRMGADASRWVFRPLPCFAASGALPNLFMYDFYCLTCITLWHTMLIAVQFDIPVLYHSDVSQLWLHASASASAETAICQYNAK